MRGRYLDWSAETGFWLDTVPRDAHGLPLRPLVSAAADSGIPFGAHFKILDCGVDGTTGRRVDKSVCRRLTSPQWEVRDRFSEGHVGKRLNLFVGEQSPGGLFWKAGGVVSTKNATISLNQ